MSKNSTEKGLEALIALEKAACDFGFAWENSEQILAQIRSECDEVQGAISKQESAGRLQSEVGDLLHACFSLCVFLGFDPLQTLEQSVEKFSDRFKRVCELARLKGFENLKGQSFETLMEFWSEAKSQVSK